MGIGLHIAHVKKVQSCQKLKNWWKLLIFLCLEDVSNSSPVLSILSPLKGNEQDKKGKEQDICLAGGFFPQEKTMTLILEGKNPVNLQSNNAELFKSSKTYYYAGFNGDPIQTCKMDGEEADTTPDALVTGLYLNVLLLFNFCFM